MEKNKWNKIEQVFVSPLGFEKELAAELAPLGGVMMGRLACLEHELNKWPIWQQQRWSSVQTFEFESIKQAVTQLRGAEKNRDCIDKQPLFWVNASQEFHRRSALLSENLRMAKFKKIEFLEKLNNKKIGCFALLTPNKMIYSINISNAFSLGEFQFIENKEIPPSRAYLKLWELFTINKIKPQKNELCLDMGSCPGGWTWVLQTLGCHVISVDKAPLNEKIATLDNIKFLKKDAFKLNPVEVGPVSWFFSDIICEPIKLYDLVLKWKESGMVKHFVCTIKFKGKTDFATVEKFKKIQGSQIFHLHHNKHELTWVC